MEERRDIKNNGYGRRPYDNEFLNHCLSCSLREEMKEMEKSKVDWKRFVWIVSGILAICGAILAIGSKIAFEGATRMLDTSKQTLDAVHLISERTVKIETEQRVMMSHIEKTSAERDVNHGRDTYRTRPDGE